jgi:AraC-like DNA-binding protein
MTPSAQPAAIAWTPLVYFWEGGWIGVGRAPSVVPPHEHHAVQIALGLDGPIRLQDGEGQWREHRLAVVQADVRHAFDPNGALTSFLFVDPDGREGRWLRDSLRAPISDLPIDLVAPHLPALLSFQEARPGPAAAGRIVTGVVEALCQGPPPLRGMDERVARALELMRADGSGRLGLSAVAAQVFLSPSRFAHLFTAEVGLPFRRYVLWRKLNRAMAAFGRGATLSAAAHAAGFADSAHLTRTWRAMFGITPSTMVGMAEFYEIPAPFEIARAAA